MQQQSPLSRCHERSANDRVHTEDGRPADFEHPVSRVRVANGRRDVRGKVGDEQRVDAQGVAEDLRRDAVALERLQNEEEERDPERRAPVLEDRDYRRVERAEATAVARDTLPRRTKCG